MTQVQQGSRVTGTKNEQYDLISALYHSLESAATYDTYRNDAQQAGDQELVQFFQDVKEQNRQCAERAKQLLAQRMG